MPDHHGAPLRPLDAGGPVRVGPLHLGWPHGLEEEVAGGPVLRGRVSVLTCNYNLTYVRESF